MPTPDDAALRASAGLELLHAFALLQDDVMDDSPLRRGRPAAHVQFGRVASRTRPVRFPGALRRIAGDPAFGPVPGVGRADDARERRADQDALARAWPHYDAMRIELAVGQFADVANDAGALPDLDAVLDVARRKSGNYTVRRPLEIGAAMAGREELIDALGGYGSAIGEAFQLRDDILGVFGSPAVTGKPAGGDLAERKATSVVVAAHRMADASIRRQFAELMNADGTRRSRHRPLAHPDRGDRCGGVDRGLDRRTASPAATRYICDDRIDDWVQSALADMAAVCTLRVT